MTKENAEKFYALYQQHQAIAKRLAALNAKTEDELLEGLVKMAQEVGLQLTVEELSEQIGNGTGEVIEDLAGGGTTYMLAVCTRVGGVRIGC